MVQLLLSYSILSQIGSSQHENILIYAIHTHKMLKRCCQSVVYARRAGDENPDLSVVSETMTLLGNSSSGYQIMDRSKYIESREDGKRF